MRTGQLYCAEIPALQRSVLDNSLEVILFFPVARDTCVDSYEAADSKHQRSVTINL